MGRRSIKMAKKKFAGTCDKWKLEVKSGEISKVKDEMTEQCISGLNKAKDILKDPDIDEEVDALIEEIDVEKVDHRKTREFMTRIKSVQEEDEFIELINDFETFYLEKLDKMGA